MLRTSMQDHSGAPTIIGAPPLCPNKAEIRGGLAKYFGTICKTVWFCMQWEGGLIKEVLARIGPKRASHPTPSEPLTKLLGGSEVILRRAAKWDTYGCILI